IPNFLRELHAALNSEPVVAAALRETVAMDPNRTIASVTQPEIPKTPDLSATATQLPVAQETNFGASFDSLAGTVSGAQLDKEIEGDAQRKQRAEEERQSNEREDRRKKEQQEKFERRALQAKELED